MNKTTNGSEAALMLDDYNNIKLNNSQMKKGFNKLAFKDHQKMNRKSVP